MARPSEYDFNLCLEICEKVSLGAHIKTVLDSQDNYPTFPTWCKWKRENSELFNLYVGSIQDKAEMVTFEINQVMIDLRAKEIDAATARTLIDTLKWFAAKFYPKMFGDKLDVTTGGEKLPSVVEFIRVKKQDE